MAPWREKAKRYLQEQADSAFEAWLETKEGKRWKGSKKTKSPYYCGFDLPQGHRELIAALSRGDEERAKAIMLYGGM